MVAPPRKAPQPADDVAQRSGFDWKSATEHGLPLLVAADGHLEVVHPGFIGFTPLIAKHLLGSVSDEVTNTVVFNAADPYELQAPQSNDDDS